MDIKKKDLISFRRFLIIKFVESKSKREQGLIYTRHGKNFLLLFTHNGNMARACVENFEDIICVKHVLITILIYK